MLKEGFYKEYVRAIWKKYENGSRVLWKEKVAVLRARNEKERIATFWLRRDDVTSILTLFCVDKIEFVTRKGDSSMYGRISNWNVGRFHDNTYIMRNLYVW